MALAVASATPALAEASPPLLPSWMVEHPNAMVQNGQVVGLDLGEWDPDTERCHCCNGLSGGVNAFSGGGCSCQQRAEFSFFFWGDSELFGGAQQYPKKMADNFLPGLPESSLGAGDDTAPGTPMRINGLSLSAYFSKFVDGDGDGATDPDFLNPDIDPATPGDQPYALWTVRYFSDANGDRNPSTPQTVPGVPDELLASFVYPGSLADPGALLPTQPMTMQHFPNEPGTAFDFFGFGPARPTTLIFSHAPVPVVAGDCYWLECAPQFNELVPGSTALLQVGLWNAGLGGDGWMWYNSGIEGFYTSGVGEQGPSADRNWCLDIEELGINNPGEYGQSAIDLSRMREECTNDPCFDNFPPNDDCIDAYQMVIGEASPFEFSITACAQPVEIGEFRNPVGSSIELAQAIWYSFVGDGTTVLIDTCGLGNPLFQSLSGGPRLNATISVFCGSGCNDLYFLGEEDAVGRSPLCEADIDGCSNITSPGFYLPQLSIPTVAGQT